MPENKLLNRLQIALRAFRQPQVAQRGWVSHPTYPPHNLYFNGDYAAGQDFTDDNSSYARAYIAVSAVRTCVDTYAWAIGQIPTRIIYNSTYDRANDKERAKSEDVKPRHIWYEATRWHQRNLNIGLIPALLYNTMLTDAAYVLKLKSQFNSSPRLQVLNSQGMQVEDHTGYVTHFRYSHTGGYETYQPSEIAYNHGFNPFYDTRGASLVSSIIQEINIDRNLDTFLQAFFKNDAMPGMTAAPADGTKLNEAQWEALKEILRQYHKGVGNRRRALVLRERFDFNVLQEPDIEKHTSIQDPINKAIFQAFGVPLVLVGDNSGTAYKDAENVLANFIKMRVQPIATDLQAFINDLCLPFLDNSADTRFEFDFDAISTETEADSIKMQNATTGYTNNILTLNEARQRVGENTLSSGDVFSSGITLQELEAEPVIVESPSPALLPQPTETPALAEVIDRDTGRSITIMLGLANDPNLLILQRQVKEFCKDFTVTWNTSDNFHITLIHLPDADDGQLARLMGWAQSVELPDLTLKVGSFNRFESVGQYALHFRIRQNATLTELQTGAVEWLEGQGMTVSPYSQPESYIPHITMGYAESKPPRWTFDSKLSVRPQTLQLSFNGEVIYEREWAADTQRAMPDSEDAGIRTWDLDTPDTLHDNQVAELEQWQKYTWTRYKRGTQRAFEPNWLRGEKADALRAVLDKATDYESAKRIFTDYREQFSQRDIQATRSQFEDAFDQAIQAAMAGHKNRRQTGIELRRIVLRGINAAYRDGLKAGGVDAEPDEPEQEAIAEMAANQRQYINGLMAKLFKEEAVTPALAEQKAQMWWGNSVQPAYYAGFKSAARNQMMEFTGEDGEDSCNTCQRLKHQRHRLKDWDRKQLIPQQHGENYDCNGFNCHHILTAIEGKARGRW